MLELNMKMQNYKYLWTQQEQRLEGNAQPSTLVSGKKR